MKQQYVLCKKHTESNRLVYYTGKTESHGHLFYGNILEAKRFDSLQEVAELIAKPSSEFLLGINIIGIADITFEKIKESKTQKGDGGELYRKYHDVNYAIR